MIIPYQCNDIQLPSYFKLVSDFVFNLATFLGLDSWTFLFLFIRLGCLDEMTSLSDEKGVSLGVFSNVKLG